jgi:chemotaxis protein CheX
MTVMAPDLARIAQDIWTAMLGLELTEVPVGNLDQQETLTAGVQITGDWEGAVTIALGVELATRATAVMFGMEPEEVGDEEIADTIGELANMTGGNVKSLLDGTCQLSLPSVTRGRDYQITVPGSRMLDHTVLDCDGHLVVITLLARSA